uniref:Spermatosis associated serine rich 2 like n=1 Tax=Latimeria chalumnae TaxID=7897 RepID=H3BFK5_LATCH
IVAVRSVVPNKSNNEIVLVLQQFDNNVDKAVHAFMDGSAVQVLKEWNLTGKKKNYKRKRNKAKHKDMKETPDKSEDQEARGIKSYQVNGCDVNISLVEPLSGRLETISIEEKSPVTEEKQEQSNSEIRVNHSLQCDRLVVETGHQLVQDSGAPELSKPAAEQQHNPGRPKTRNPVAKTHGPTDQTEVMPEDLRKKVGPNIEKSVKDLQRCTVSLTRYRMMIKDEMDASVKRIKANFAELQSCIIDREVALMAEMDKVKEEAMEILNARQRKAEELRRLADLAIQMSEEQLSQLRAEIKLFVSERKYDEELGRSARFSCDGEQLKTQIQSFGEVSHPKNNYSIRIPCNTILSSMSQYTVTGKHAFQQKSKALGTKAISMKTAASKDLSKAKESTAQKVSTDKQNDPSPQKRRFFPRSPGQKVNGVIKLGGKDEGIFEVRKIASKYDTKKQPHSTFRPRNKGSPRNQNNPSAATPCETLSPTEKTKVHHELEAIVKESFSNSVSQYNSCPGMMEPSADKSVLSVPSMTLVV